MADDRSVVYLLIVLFVQGCQQVLLTLPIKGTSRSHDFRIKTILLTLATCSARREDYCCPPPSSLFLCTLQEATADTLFSLKLHNAHRRLPWSMCRCCTWGTNTMSCTALRLNATERDEKDNSRLYNKRQHEQEIRLKPRYHNTEQQNTDCCMTNHHREDTNRHHGKSNQPNAGHDTTVSTSLYLAAHSTVAQHPAPQTLYSRSQRWAATFSSCKTKWTSK